jgi:hypothetical protein
MNDLLFKEIYQFLFVVSATYFVCVALLFVYRVVRNVGYDVNTKMTFSALDKILLLISFGVIISYLI